jgi:hypothetical protein
MKKIFTYKLYSKNPIYVSNQAQVLAVEFPIVLVLDVESNQNKTKELKLKIYTEGDEIPMCPGKYIGNFVDETSFNFNLVFDSTNIKDTI